MSPARRAVLPGVVGTEIAPVARKRETLSWNDALRNLRCCGLAAAVHARAAVYLYDTSAARNCAAGLSGHSSDGKPVPYVRDRYDVRRNAERKGAFLSRECE